SFVSDRLTKYAGELDVGTKKYTGRENMQMEIIVGISQAVAQYGFPLVQKFFPKLTKYYNDTFAAACTNACAQDPVLNANPVDTNKDVGTAKPLTPMPDKLFTSVGEMNWMDDK